MLATVKGTDNGAGLATGKSDRFILKFHKPAD